MIRSSLLYLLVLTAASSLRAEETAQPLESPVEKATETGKPQESQVQEQEILITDEELKAVETRKPGERRPSLRNRKISTAFRRFVPSDAITADNAVPFPVDI